MVTLSRPQAALLARDLADGLEAQAHQPEPPRRLDDTSAVIVSGGRLCLDDLPPAGTNGNGSHGPVVRDAINLARRLGRNAERIRPGAPDSTLAWPHLCGTDGTLAELASHIRAESARLIGDAEPPHIDRLRAEVGALAAAVVGQRVAPPHERPAPPHEQPTAAAGPHHPYIWRPSDRQAWHSRRPRPPWKPVLVMAVLAGLIVAAGWGAPRAWDEIRDRWDGLFATEPPPRLFEPLNPLPEADADADADANADADADADPSAPAEIEPPAPDSAGPIKEVTLSAVDDACRAGNECLVQVEVALDPAASSRAVSWSFEIIDRCEESTSTEQGVGFVAQAGWSLVWGNTFLEIPSGSALAVIAVTNAPADAASSPMLIPAADDAATC